MILYCRENFKSDKQKRLKYLLCQVIVSLKDRINYHFAVFLPCGKLRTCLSFSWRKIENYWPAPLTVQLGKHFLSTDHVLGLLME
jgi:hypothetical protein